MTYKAHQKATALISETYVNSIAMELLTLQPESPISPTHLLSILPLVAISLWCGQRALSSQQIKCFPSKDSNDKHQHWETVESKKTFPLYKIGS
jgi:hypothetical protein